MIKVALVISHPIQHFCPMYVSWAALPEVDLMVFFGSTQGKEVYRDKRFGEEIKWEDLRLDFGHKFLNGGRLVDVSSNLDAEELDSELDEFSPDVLVVHGYSQKLQRRASNWGQSRGVYMLMISDSELRRSRSLLVRMAKKLILPRIYSKITKFLTVGDANEEYYSNYRVTLERFIRSPFPIDRDKYQNAFDNRKAIRKKTRTRLGIKENTVVVSVVGKLIPSKRQRDLIKALNYIDEGDIILALLIIGTGPDENELRMLSKHVRNHQIIYTGFIQPNDLIDYYIASDIYASPSERDAHSLAVSEAIFCGCSIIVSDRCGSYGPTDDVQIGYNGFVYNCGDVQQLAHYIKKLAQSEELMFRFSRNSRIIGVQNQIMAHGEGLRSALTALELL